MGYQMANGRWADTQEVSLRDSAALTETANGTAVEVGERGVLRLTLDVTAASGTDETLDVAIQTSEDDTTWASVGSFTQVTAAGSQRKIFAGCDRYVRATYTIGGTDTPSFTFSLSGEAV